MSWSQDDFQHMRRAIELARRGRFSTRPNPAVGCVIVRDGRVVGEGFHPKAGEPHAEVFALRAAGELARGATAYVTLEPCSHYGRTPPCAEALIRAGVGRVVAAMVDPNPQVAGRGLSMLREAGIEVASGLLEGDALAINPGFIKRMSEGRPFIRIKLAASVDGRTALANGHSKWITGPQARQDVQRMRLAHGAIITGADSVLADDPAMNVRPEQLPASLTLPDTWSQPLRVVVDGRARLAPPLRLTAIESPVLLASTRAYGCDWPDWVESWQGPSRCDKLDLHALVAELAERQINTVMVEAGASLAGAFLSAGLWDELILYQAPKMMGSDGRGVVNLPELAEMTQVPEFQFKDVRRVGADLRLTLVRAES
ncbi:bifunctional diaminohydroxyphosphoribosylaminopyrimidine deaminase/5-amino-6-(5-phosphoribosylamino)uracil reductase RibD [Ferrimonas sediminicola]|uniref:Riboflavin biosynthesis protein RibD n=1 Tax=Ferrimonas sediminicola TaxID=2569538 RepID=A0A4U1BEY7_9GAMM|nr:bifunctional diaminohydroxyphosphoribosylaminopyrimidine deaminase/5-amino-6-(5-phosphoribosylamino)uracil reductase RibD [Ferrimonas sediminicola]TKB49237.1 bifunctional diaminohydroxyphosphoribosylaminopyrimidine deaminase/5-amino-6-(5-phosphoribosylamino)uracil reductase RibD [Ferrimonas sediminicola]